MERNEGLKRKDINLKNKDKEVTKVKLWDRKNLIRFIV